MNEPVPVTPFEAAVLKALDFLLVATLAGYPFAHSRVYADRQLIQRAGIYHGGLLLADGVGASTVAVYDGLDTSGELIDSFSVAASTPDRHIYEKGIALRVGLYLDLGSNVSAFTAYYDPVPREKG